MPFTQQQKIEAITELIQANDPTLTTRQARRRATDLANQIADIQSQIDDLQDRLGR